MNLSATSPLHEGTGKHMVSRSPLNTGGHLSPCFATSTSPSSRNPLLSPLSPLSEKNICKDCNCTTTSRLPCQCHTCLSSNDGMTEMLASLALMCLLSLLTAFLALFFMQKSSTISDGDFINDSTHPITTSGTSVLSSSHGVSQSRLPSYNRKEHLKVSQISLSLCTLTISLNLSCLFVCCIQFLSAAKLLKTPQGVKRYTFTASLLFSLDLLSLTAVAMLILPLFLLPSPLLTEQQTSSRKPLT